MSGFSAVASQRELTDQLVADEGEPGGPDLMQRAELAVRVPPLRRDGAEARDLGVIDVGSWRSALSSASGVMGRIGRVRSPDVKPGRITSRCAGRPCCDGALMPVMSSRHLRLILRAGERHLALAALKAKIQTTQEGARREQAMAVVVMKFGGTSVADVDRIRNVARHVKREVDGGNKVAVVVSAMAGTTNQLVAWVQEASPLA